jgi:hypothetical protein
MRKFPIGFCNWLWRRYLRADLSHVFDEDIFGLSVCLKRTVIEEIILNQPGEVDFLHSKDRFMTLLGRGVRRLVVTDDDTKVSYFRNTTMKNWARSNDSSNIVLHWMSQTYHHSYSTVICCRRTRSTPATWTMLPCWKFVQCFERSWSANWGNWHF